MPKPEILSLMMCGNTLVYFGYILNSWTAKAGLFCPGYMTRRQELERYGQLPLHKHRNARSIRITHADNGSMVAFLKPQNWGWVETGGFSGQPTSPMVSKLSERPCPKTMQSWVMEEGTDQFPTSTGMHTQRSMHSRSLLYHICSLHAAILQLQ